MVRISLKNTWLKPIGGPRHVATLLDHYQAWRDSPARQSCLHRHFLQGVTSLVKRVRSGICYHEPLFIY